MTANTRRGTNFAAADKLSFICILIRARMRAAVQRPRTPHARGPRRAERMHARPWPVRDIGCRSLSVSGVSLAESITSLHDACSSRITFPAPGLEEEIRNRTGRRPTRVRQECRHFFFFRRSPVCQLGTRKRSRQFCGNSLPIHADGASVLFQSLRRRRSGLGWALWRRCEGVRFQGKLCG